MSLRKRNFHSILPILAVLCLLSPYAVFAAALTAPGAPVSGKDLLVAPVPVPKEGKADVAQKTETAPAAAESKPSAETAGSAGKTEASAGKAGSVPAAPAASPPSTAQTPKAEPAGASSAAAAGSSVPGSPSAPASPPAAQASPMFTLDILRAQLEEKKLRVAIEEQDSKLRQLRNPPSPAPAVTTPASLDLLLNPPTAKQSASPKTSGGSPARPKGPYVESIQGVNGKLSATVRSGGKAMTLRPGDSFAGGVVEAIQYNQVTIRRGKARSVLPFSE